MKLRIKLENVDIISFLNALSVSGYYFNVKLVNIGQEVEIGIINANKGEGVTKDGI